MQGNLLERDAPSSCNSEDSIWADFHMRIPIENLLGKGAQSHDQGFVKISANAQESCVNPSLLHAAIQSNSSNQVFSV